MRQLSPDWYERPRLLLIARVVLVSAFLVSGILKAIDFPAAVSEVRALSGRDLATLLAVLVIIVQLGGSALVIAGGRIAWAGALLLAGFTLVATIIAHDFWSKQGPAQIRNMTTFFEHRGLIAGLLFAAILAEHRPQKAKT